MKILPSLFSLLFLSLPVAVAAAPVQPGWIFTPPALPAPPAAPAPIFHPGFLLDK